jgi:hypothetical protein
MKYTKEQLEAPLGVLLVKNTKRKDLGDWKRWRIVNADRNEYPFSIEELVANESAGTVNISNLFSSAHKSEFFMDVCWHVSEEYSTVGNIVLTTKKSFITQQEAKDCIDKEIALLLPITSRIVGTYPEEGD